MLSQILLAFLPYAFVTAFTPGPNNIFALNTISRYGWKKGRRAIIGIAAGFLCVMTLCAFGCYELSKYLPFLTRVMKYVGATYIVWLAVHIARSKPGGEAQEQKPSFWTGFILQFVNVKIILYGISVYTGYVLPVSQSPSYLLAAVIASTIVGVSGTLTWAFAGGVLKKYINRYDRAFSLAMAFILVFCAIQMIFM